MQDGYKGAVQALGQRFGDLREEPYIQLMGMTVLALSLVVNGFTSTGNTGARLNGFWCSPSSTTALPIGKQPTGW